MMQNVDFLLSRVMAHPRANSDEIKLASNQFENPGTDQKNKVERD
jgi:hypothetical protein